MQNKISIVRDRMLQIAIEQDVNKYELSKKISKGRGFFDPSQMEFNPNFDAICAFLKIFNDIDANWLLFGEGKKLKHNNLCENDKLCSQQNLLQQTKNQETESSKIIALQSKIDVLIGMISEKDAVIAENNKQIGKLESEIDMLKDKKTREAIEFMPLSSGNDLD